MSLNTQPNATTDPRPWIALGLTFLLLGIGFATPFPLVTRFPPGIWQGVISHEALNLYALTAFLGWGHFAYAWQGQSRATRRFTQHQAAGYWLLIAATLLGLLALRHLLGVAIFSLSVWVYNIGHFIKAESHFAGQHRRSTYRTSTIAFAWFTLVLFQVGPLKNGSLVFILTSALALAALYTGDWRALTSGQSRLPLLTLFFLGETLVWSAYEPYMKPAFRVGLYVFHIAAASFFHYISSYVFAQRGPATPPLLRLRGLLAVNVTILALGCLTDRVPALRPLRFILSPEWFTLWVALHLIASDALPWWRKRATSSPAPSPTAPAAPA